MNIIYRILTTATLTLCCTVVALAQYSKLDRDSTVLAYRPNSSILMVDYKNNAKQLQNMFAYVKKNAEKLRANQSHINVVSYIKGSEVNVPEAINNASIQASVVRAEFKSRFDIPHSAITFSIDTTQNVNNLVRVDYIASPMPRYSNNAIYYSENKSISAIRAQMERYTPGVPYTNYWMHLAKLDPNMIGSLAVADVVAVESGKSIAMEPAKKSTFIEPVTPSEQTVAIAPVKESTPASSDKTVVATTHAEKQEKRAEGKSANTLYSNKQVFGLKTNLVSWLVALPNLELEFYLGNMVSLNFEGSYTWGWFLPKDKAYFAWKAGGEVRFWLKNDGQFKGHYLGLYGMAGQYDFKFGQYGNQGDFYGAGISYGYLLPIKNRFHMEFALGAGWANYSRLKYIHVDGYNFTEQYTPSNNFFGVTKVKVSCVWRF